ncbi:MAG: hypothetical protein U1E29_14460 [Coriobacteriia bacterium]|nr:hypothetical protein [Coriobacteriia bacterium]
MRIDVELHADYAAVTQEGKLVIGGVFDLIAPPTLPWQHPTMTLVFRVRLSGDEAGTHSITVRGIDPEGAEFIPSLTGELAAESVDFLDGMATNFMLGINGVRLEKAGHYHFDVYVDDRYEETIAFAVKEPPDETPAAR